MNFMKSIRRIIIFKRRANSLISLILINTIAIILSDLCALTSFGTSPYWFPCCWFLLFDWSFFAWFICANLVLQSRDIWFGLPQWKQMIRPWSSLDGNLWFWPWLPLGEKELLLLFCRYPFWLLNLGPLFHDCPLWLLLFHRGFLGPLFQFG